jgi:adenylosuccinate synthase
VAQKLNSRYKLGQDEFAFGWTDLNLIGHGERSCQLSSLFLTHLDVLDDLEEIKICVGYETPDGKIVKGGLPATIYEYGNMKAKYEVLKGW